MNNSTYVPIMPFIFLALLLLPIRLAPSALMRLAFALWLIGGGTLLFMGVTRLMASGADTMPLMLGGVIALVIGAAKGKFVLSKTSEKNIERLNEMREPARPIHVYSKRSWIVIAVMVGIAILLNTLPQIDLYVRGLVNLAIGCGLLMSSLNYLRALKPQPSH